MTTLSSCKITVAAEAFKNALIKIAQENGHGFEFADDDLHLLKGVLRYMNDDELALFAKVGHLTSEAVAEFLGKSIRPLRFQERIKLGEKMNYWRIWRKIVEVPGLSHDEISQIQRTYKCS